MSNEDFESRRRDHGLQPDDKVDIMFLLLTRWFKHQYPVKFQELKEKWMEEVN